MGSPESEQVLSLLKELAGLKEMDREVSAPESDSAQEARRLRDQRHGEITDEIKELADQKKKASLALQKSGE